MQFILIFFLGGGGGAWSTIATVSGGNTTQEPNWVFPKEYLASSYTFLEVEEDTYMGKSFLTILVNMYSSIFLHYSKKRYFEINLIKINWQFTLSLNSSASLFSAFRKYFSESTLDNAAMKRSFLGTYTCMKIM